MAMTLYKRGSRGEMVRQIQKALNLLPDGIYGQLTEERVKDFQSRHGLTADGVVGPKTLALLVPAAVGNAMKPTHSYGYGQSHELKKSRRRIDEIIVHCTATPEGKDYSVLDIRRWHKERGWSDIGYHYVVYRNGHIEDGRDVDISGAHCEGHNSHSIGVCYVGGMDSQNKNPKDTRTLAQKAALLALLTDLRRLYPSARILGHRDLSVKQCPSFDAKREYRDI